jgi:hypothetical protein
MAMTPPPHTRRDRGRLILGIILTLLLIAGVWFFFLGRGAQGPLLPPISRG